MLRIKKVKTNVTSLEEAKVTSKYIVVKLQIKLAEIVETNIMFYQNKFKL